MRLRFTVYEQMNRGCNVPLTIIGIITIILLILGFYFLHVFREAFGTNCEEVKKCNVKDYQIREFSCIGWAGPPWYPMDIYKGGKKIAENVIKSDSCNVIFRKEEKLYICLNICDNTIREIQPSKNLLSLKNIDSIKIYSTKQKQTKRLESDIANKIVTDWNKSRVWDFRDQDFESIFYPSYDYKISVFQNGGVFELITKDNIAADKSKWTYIVSSDKNKEYFDKIWNRK